MYMYVRVNKLWGEYIFPLPYITITLSKTCLSHLLLVGVRRKSIDVVTKLHPNYALSLCLNHKLGRSLYLILYLR